MQKVCDDLYIGRRLLARELPTTPRFDHYLDLTAEIAEPKAIRTMQGYRCFRMLDASVPTEAELRSLLREMKDGVVFIHCAQGHGRTGTVALALLHNRGRITSVEEGLRVLRKIRPGLALNTEQQRFVEGMFAKPFWDKDGEKDSR